MKKLTFILILSISTKIFSQSFEYNDNKIEIKINSYFQNDSTLISIFEIKNISKSLIYLPKGGYTELFLFPLNNEVLLDLTNSKIGYGNGHYYQTYVDLDLLEPNKIFSFTIPYKTNSEKYKNIILRYEYLLSANKIKNKKMIAYKYVKHIDKIKIKYISKIF